MKIEKDMKLKDFEELSEKKHKEIMRKLDKESDDLEKLNIIEEIKRIQEGIHCKIMDKLDTEEK